MAATRRLAAIMFTDMVGFTASAQADEATALKLLREQEKLIRPLLAAHHGRRVKSTGDGLLLEFEDALDAVECGAEFQRQLHERNAQEGVRPLRIRVGIHLGDVQRRGTDILGDAVNIAARIEPLAEPGGVCISAQVFDQVHNKVPYSLEKLGPKTLKGLRESVEVYRVMLPWIVEAASPEGAALPRLAVLPFANISPDPNDEYFADGLTEELISVISQIRGLRVTSRTSVSQFKASSKSVSQIGKELGVSSVLEGSVRKSGDRLRITVQLIDVQTDDHRWAQTYDRKFDDVFAIQAEVAESTAGALKVELLKSERQTVVERPTTTPAAYEAYLRGVEASMRFHGRGTEEIDREAESHFEEAIRADPSFAAAYARLAVHLMLVAGETRSWKDVTVRIRGLVAKAMELNLNSSDAHVARGALALQVDHQWDRAEAEFQQAIALNPSSSEARSYYAYLLLLLQRFGESRKQYLSAIDQDPLNPVLRQSFAWVQEVAGDLQSAISWREKLVKDYPDNPGFRGVLGWAYARAGRAEDATKTLEPLANAPDLRSRTSRASVLALLGKPEELRAVLADWEGGRLSERYDVRYAAEGYALLGEYERALALLERDDREEGKNLWNVYLSSAFDPIRDDPRFVAMLRALNLPTTLARPFRPVGVH